MNKTKSAQWETLLCGSLSCFVAFIDFAIVNTALPAIQKELNASVLQLQWMMNAFVLAVSVLMVIMGRLSDLYGRRLLNIVGVSIFGVFSLFAGFATNPLWLIISRLMQGVATAIIIPSSLALISHAYENSQKGRAIGIWSSITGIGLAIGPVLGGFLVSALNWRWIFYINIPFAIVSLILAFKYVEESKENSANKAIDLKGFVLITLGITSIVVALIQAPDWGWLTWRTLSLLVLGIIFLILFYFNERTSSSSIIPFYLFTHRTFLCCCIAQFTMVFFIWSAFFLMPLYLHTIRGEKPYIIGLMLLPITALIVLLSPLAGRMIESISAKVLILFGLFCLALSALGQLYFTDNSSTFYVILTFVFMGIAWAFVTNPSNTQGISSLPSQLSGTATGVLWTVQNIGGSIGLAVTGTVFRDIYTDKTSSILFLKGYHAAMGILFGLTVLTIIILIGVMKREKITSKNITPFIH